MNKSVTFLAISLLMVSSMVHALDTSSWQAQGTAVLVGLAAHAKQVGIGVATGFATNAGFRLLENGLGLSEKTKGFQTYTRMDEVKLVIGAGGSVVVAGQVNSFLGANSDQIGMVATAERTAGVLLGMFVADNLKPRMQAKGQ